MNWVYSMNFTNQTMVKHKASTLATQRHYRRDFDARAQAANACDLPGPQNSFIFTIEQPNIEAECPHGPWNKSKLVIIPCNFACSPSLLSCHLPSHWSSAVTSRYHQRLKTTLNLIEIEKLLLYFKLLSDKTYTYVRTTCNDVTHM